MKLKYQSRFHKKAALSLAVIMFLQTMSPIATWALTSGPTQPEVQSFEPIGTTQMVDLFSGDFSYNIPLLEVPGANGGYPINLFYNSVTNIEEEASMVGLGWNIGIGALTNNVRGLPDAFDGDIVTRTTDMKNNWTLGLGVSKNFEIFSADIGKGLQGTLGLGVKFLYNSYKGIGYSLDPGLSINMGNKDPSAEGLSLSTNFGFSLNSLEGASVNSGVSITKTEKEIKKDGEGIRKGSIGLSMSMSGREGLKTISLSRTVSEGRIEENEESGEDEYKSKGSITGSNTYTFSNTTYTPQVQLPYGGTNISFGVKFGSDVGGLFSNVSTSGFFSGQWLKHKDDARSAPAYGYMHAQNAHKRKNSLMDFNREKDGQIYPEQPNLAIPIATPDILSVAGHGLGGSYRAYRSDWGGVFLDPEIKNRTAGGAFGIEFGPGMPTHLGFNAARNFSENKSVQGFHERKDFKFYEAELGSDFEPYYYKAMGEITAELEEDNLYENMGGDMPIRLKRKGWPQRFQFSETFVRKDGVEIPDAPVDPNNPDEPNDGPLGRRLNGKRKARSNSIQPITNQELLNAQGNPLLPEYDISIYDFSDNGETVITTYDPATMAPLSRNTDQGNHIAGYTVLNAGGSKWNYALPVMNHTQYQASFSVESPNGFQSVVEIDKDGNGDEMGDIQYKVSHTDKYKDVVQTPAYAHAHLLTSVLGTDYIDADDIPGPSDGDQGYWMRVEYVKTSDHYLWKSPFNGATFLEGYNSKDTDDKATFIAGDREQYYPGRVVTNTHVAEFMYSQRNDSRAAGNILQNTGDPLGHYSYKLDGIKLFSKIDLDQNPNAQPIKTIHFEYDYSLCKGVLNNENNQSEGKLTLKKVWFTYEQSTRGALSPYTFEYNNIDDIDLDPNPDPTLSNPDYGQYKFDRWGVYREGTAFDNIFNPYVKQFEVASNTGLPMDNGDILDKEIASWHVTDIFLPSGSHIHVDVGRDHYGYVQDRTAAQMFQISRLGPNLNDNILSKEANPSAEERKVYFKLEQAIDVNDPEIQDQLKQYTDDLFDDGNGKQLFFQINADLTNHNTFNLNEDVSGYTEIVKIGVDPSCITNNHYAEAYIELKDFPLEIRNKKYHPMLVSNWQYLKTNLPDQMFGYNLGSYPNTKTVIANKVGQFAGMMNELIAVFRNYYKFCKSENYGRRLNLTKSFIRLNSPDKKKYGGGVRVNKVTMRDTYWGDVDETPPTYGVVYDYEMDEEVYDPVEQKIVKTGRKISSGVATNEPSIGREECALRYSKSYKNEVKFRSDNLFIFEYPVNESYYPGPSIGYSKVSVKSLASEYALKRAQGEGLAQTLPELPEDLPEGFAVSGMTVNEFYTAKDFPIITEETTVDHHINGAPWIPIPFIGEIRTDKYTGSQGYMIELNDMHGKPKSVTSYAQDKSGFILEDPESSVEYKYIEKPTEVYHLGGTHRLRHRLDNEVTVLLSEKMDMNDPTQTERSLAELGVERELFMDTRESTSRSISGGIDYNTEVFLFAPIPIPWPSFNLSTTKLKTAVTNKIIRRSGILKQVIASDGKSKVITDNLCFDRYTGQPILSTVNNSYDEKIYNYSIPGHFAYEQMGPAYQNWGLKFLGSIGDRDTETGLFPVPITSLSKGMETADLLKEGDELILGSTIKVGQSSNPYEIPEPNQIDNGGLALVVQETPFVRGTFIRKLSDNNTLLFALDIPEDANVYLGEMHFHLIRSGNRNHLGTAVGSITSLVDPTKNRTTEDCLVPAPCGGAFAPGCVTSVDAYSIDSVINASAVTYSKTWAIDESNCGLVATSPDPYKTGRAGIWRPYRSFAYVKDRKQSNPDVDLSQDGTYTLDVFNWANPLQDHCSDWRMVEETTKYGAQNQALESRNVLDIYNAALYGYNDYLPTAVAANARYNEIGFNGFEQYQLDNPTVPLSTYQGEEVGNIELQLACEEGTRYTNSGEIYRIAEAIDHNTVDGLTIEKAFDDTYDPEVAIVNLVDLGTGKEYVIDLDVAGMVNNGSGKTKVQIDMGALWAYLPSTKKYAGHISLLKTQEYITSTPPGNEVYFVKRIAHSGNQSLMVADQSVTFEQRSLNLKPNKNYVLSAWVNVTQLYGKPAPTYADDHTGIKFGQSALMEPSGTIIEGWQRIEEVFEVNAGDSHTLTFQSSGTPTYYDDVRIYPLDGGMQTYVYDKANYRVTEVLDNNNYYTRYKYDSEGNLISVQKETEDGLRTLQESGSYVRNNE